MGRKPVLGMAGALLTSLALAGCQNSPPKPPPPAPFYPGHAGVGETTQTKTSTASTNPLGGGSTYPYNTTTQGGGSGGNVVSIPQPPTPVMNPTPPNSGGFGSPSASGTANFNNFSATPVPTYNSVPTGSNTSTPVGFTNPAPSPIYNSTSSSGSSQPRTPTGPPGLTGNQYPGAATVVPTSYTTVAPTPPPQPVPLVPDRP